MVKKPPHGTLARYELDCSCKKCRAANATAVRQRRAEARERFERGEVQIEHGTAIGYDYWGCRCDFCREANAERHREKNERRRDKEAV